LPIRDGEEIRLEYRLKDVLECCLNYPVLHGGNAQGAKFPGCADLLDEHAPHRRWPVCAGAKLRTQLCDECIYPLHHATHRDAVHACRSAAAVTVVTDETMGEKDPLLARLLAAATAGASPAGPAHKRTPVRIVLDPDATPVAKGKLFGQQAGFNLHAQTKVAANDKKGRENLCKYILRPPLANDRLKLLDDGDVRLEFKRPWSDGTSSVDLAPLALIARLAAIIPPPRRHVVRYSGVISSHSSLRSHVVPVPAVAAPEENDKPSLQLSHYISWSQLPKKDVRDRHRLPSLQNPTAPHRHDRDR
jgi:hypothetical protein